MQGFRPAVRAPSEGSGWVMGPPRPRVGDRQLRGSRQPAFRRAGGRVSRRVQGVASWCPTGSCTRLRCHGSCRGKMQSWRSCPWYRARSCLPCTGSSVASRSITIFCRGLRCMSRNAPTSHASILSGSATIFLQRWSRAGSGLPGSVRFQRSRSRQGIRPVPRPRPSDRQGRAPAPACCPFGSRRGRRDLHEPA